MSSKSLGKNQYIKKKVRSSKEWKQLRIDIQEEYGNTDPITLKPLRKGFNVHHLDERSGELRRFGRPFKVPSIEQVNT